MQDFDDLAVSLVATHLRQTQMLTRMEMRVIAIMAQCAGDRQDAAVELGISVGTLNVHLHNIGGKCDKLTTNQFIRSLVRDYWRARGRLEVTA